MGARVVACHAPASACAEPYRVVRRSTCVRPRTGWTPSLRLVLRLGEAVPLVHAQGYKAPPAFSARAAATPPWRHARCRRRATPLPATMAAPPLQSLI
jgi:hypothetical protein